MVKRSHGVPDLEAVLGEEIVFADDDTDRGWLTGQSRAGPIHVRMGNFPDEELWSLWLGDGRWMDFTEPPVNWTINRSPAGWPDTARPRLAKGEFYE